MAWGEGGSTRRWRQLRHRILDRDQHRCQLRLDGCTTRATTVHHTSPWVGDPADADPATLMAACSHCNLAVGDPAGSDPEPKPWASL